MSLLRFSCRRSTAFVRSRRRLLAAGGGAVLLGVGCSRRESPLAVGAHPFPVYHLVAEEVQRVRAVRWVPVSNATITRFLLRFRRIGAGLLTLDEALRERALGTPLTVVALLDTSVGADQVVVRPGWELPERFVQARVAVESTGVGVITYALACRYLGVPVDWRRTVAIAPSEQLEAWRSRQIEAAVTFEPFASYLRREGGVVIFDSGKMPPLILDVLVVHEEFIESYAREIEAVVAGFFMGLRRWQETPTAVAQTLAPRFGVAAEDVAAFFAGLHLHDCVENRERLRVGFAAECQRLVELLDAVELGPLPRGLVVPASPRFLPSCR
ncbi:MAG: ABC transporter substrate-binding protein [Hydrogenophilus sp.]|nr:ABC transporter substrate-binding protein [Hydrogenophilus sp.]